MRRMVRLFAAAIFFFVCHPALAQRAKIAPGFWVTPAVPGYGLVHPMPDAAYQPEKHTTYRIVYAMTKGPKVPTDVNSSLDHVARMVNVFVAAGVPVSHLKIVAIAYGDATELALSDKAYRAKFGVANLNLPLIAELRAVGVDVTVCAQAVAEKDYAYGDVDKSVTTALSGVTTIVTLQHKGYAFMSM